MTGEECRRSELDLAALQGTWEQIAFEANGASSPVDAYDSAGVLTTFLANHFAVRATDGTLLLEGTFTLDATVSPKTVDWIDTMGPDAGVCLLAIYELQGDDFKFIAADEGAPRPTGFATGSGLTMRVFARKPLHNG